MLYRWAALAYGGDARTGVSTCVRWFARAGFVLSVVALIVATAPSAASAATAYTFKLSKAITLASGANDRLSGPTGMAADTAGNVLFVLDSGKNRIVRYDLTTGAYLGVITGGFKGAQGLAFMPSVPGISDSARLLVADTGNNRLVLLTASGTVRDTLNYGVSGATNVAWSPTSQRFYVLNPGAGEVRTYSVAQNNGNNQLRFISSFRGSSATGSTISSTATGINVLTDGTVVIADTGNNRILRFSSTGTFINKFGSTSTSPSPGDGTLKAPRGVGSRPDGYLPVVDTGNHRVQVFESSLGGAVVAELGTPGQPGVGDNQLNAPSDALTVGTGVGILTDTGNNRVLFFQLEKTTQAPERAAINFDGLECTDCHSEDLRVEHQARARGCRSCHRNSTETGKPDYKAIGSRIAADLAEQGLVETGSCGSNTRYCHSLEAKNPTTGESRAIHGMDGYQLQHAHQPEDADGTHPTTNACTGTSGGCHSDYSTESPFWFGSHDPASAKSDYYFHQKRGTASTDLVTGVNDPVGTVGLTALEHPCITCHDQPSGRSFGEREKAEAVASGEPWTCTTTGCHDSSGKSGVYYSTSDMSCYRTPNWSSFAGAALIASTDDSSHTVEVQEFSASAVYQPLIDLVLGSSEPESADLTILADPLQLPPTSTPATRPLPLDYALMGDVH